MFSNFFDANLRKIRKTCEYQKIDLIFRSYIDKSVKEEKRQQRYSVLPLEYNNLGISTKLPLKPDRLWASASNKKNLQKICQVYLCQKVNPF